MSGERVGLVSLDRIVFHPHNVRVNLGDLRGLASSIGRFGILQPVVLEVYGDHLRIRCGHRRVAAARLAGLTRVPAIIHGSPLDYDEWLVAAVHENTRRKALGDDDRKRAVVAMREQGLTWAGIADAFELSVTGAREIAYPQAPRAPRGPRERRLRTSLLASFVTIARDRTSSGAWSTEDVLRALERVAETGTLASLELAAAR